jgi:hypothetical protein
MRARIGLFTLAFALCGCTAEMIDRHTVNQSMSVADMRYQEIMDNLAVIAHNTGTMPSFAINGGGTPQVTNLVSIEPKTSWDPVGFLSQTLNAAGKYNPQVFWTFEAVTTPAQLTALRYACIWATCGAEHVDPEGREYLRAPQRSDVFPTDPCPKNPPAAATAIPHFDVLSRLEQIPPHWLKIGCRKDVHSCACFKANCCGTYVWVDPGDMKAFSDFTLVILDIVTRDPASLAIAKPTAQVVVSDPLEIDPCNLTVSNGLCDCSQCKCSFDPVTKDPAGKPTNDCAMVVKPGEPGDQKQPSMHVTETWGVYQRDQRVCQSTPTYPYDCAVPEISCGDYIVYSGDFVTVLPYVCKQRPAGRPCPVKQLTPDDVLKQYPQFGAQLKNMKAEERQKAMQNQLNEMQLNDYRRATEPLPFPEYVPPAPAGSHAPLPTSPSNR